MVQLFITKNALKHGDFLLVNCVNDDIHFCFLNIRQISIKNHLLYNHSTSLTFITLGYIWYIIIAYVVAMTLLLCFMR